MKVIAQAKMRITKASIYLFSAPIINSHFGFYCFWTSSQCLNTYRHKIVEYSRFSRDVTAAMLVYRTIAKKVFWEFDSITMQYFSDILP